MTTSEIAVEQSENVPGGVVPQQVGNDTAADAAGELEAEQPADVELRWVDPNTLIIGVNTRNKPVLPKKYVDDIKDRGVREPIPVRDRGDGRLVVRKGQRRTLAACEAWADAKAKNKRPRLVPVLVEPDLITDEVKAQIDRIIDQLGENEHREAITDADEVRATQELLELGLTAGQIAKKRHIDTKRVKTAVQVAQSGVAVDLLAKGQIEDLIQAAVIAEFSDDEKAVEALTKAATKRPEQFDHIAQQLRDAREENRIRTELAAALAEHGVTVIERPESLHEGSVRKLSDLRPTTESERGTELTVEAHTHCPGHAAFVGNLGSWRPVTERWAAVYVCTDVKANGHPDRYPSTLTSARQTGAMTVEQKAERKKVVANNKKWRSAEAVRLKWLKGFLARKSAPKDGIRWVALMLAEGSHPVRKAMETDHELAIELLGMPKPEVVGYFRREKHVIAAAAENASAARATTLMVALVAGALEKSMGTHTWRSPSKEVQSYFRQLREWGYNLSEVELAVLEPTGTTAAADVDEANNEAETDPEDAVESNIDDAEIDAEVEEDVVGDDPIEDDPVKAVDEDVDLTDDRESAEYDADLAA